MRNSKFRILESIKRKLEHLKEEKKEIPYSTVALLLQIQQGRTELH